MKQLALATTTRDEAVARRIAKWQNKFIDALGKTPSVTHACLAAGINRTRAYEHRKKNPEFAARWEDALGRSIDDLEAKAFQLALNGEDHVAANLITWLLRCHRPEVYRERSEVAVAGGIIFLPTKQKGDE
jgi:hypothetical protein